PPCRFVAHCRSVDHHQPAAAVRKFCQGLLLNGSRIAAFLGVQNHHVGSGELSFTRPVRTTIRLHPARREKLLPVMQERSVVMGGGTVGFRPAADEYPRGGRAWRCNRRGGEQGKEK